MRHFRLVSGATIGKSTSGVTEVCPDGGPCLRIDGSSMADTLRELAERSTSDETLFRRYAERVGPGAVADLVEALDKLDAAGLLRTEIHGREGEVAAKYPCAPGRPRVVPFDPFAFGPIRLSRHALLRRVGSRLVVESPLSTDRVAVAGAGLRVVEALAEGALAPGLGVVGEELEPAVVRLLATAGMTEPSDAPDESRWEFHDLLFHARSRFGRHDGAYGGRTTVRPEPRARARGRVVESIDLPEPSGERSAPLFDVLARRRTVRSHGEPPISIEQLGALLHYAVRAGADRTVRTSWGDATCRPYPSGGGGDELRIYPLVTRCRGVTPGLYRYDASRHALDRLPASASSLEPLVAHARAGWDQPSDPQLLLVFTAEFERLFGRYSAMAYATILKNLGGLYQTLYLVATALGLAPCALGGGSPDLFATATGLDYLTEGSIGEFALGSRGSDRPAHLGGPP